MTTEQQFIEKNIDDWQKLEAYNKRLARIKISKLTHEEIKEYAALYRSAGHHLAFAKTYYAGGKSVLYLNQVLGLSHTYFYKRKKAVFSDITEYFAKGFPRAARDKQRYIISAFCAFMAGVLLIMLMSYIDEAYLFYFIAEDMIYSNNITDQLSDETWFFPLLSTMIITNNIRVAALAVTYGCFLGLGTLYVILYNGINIGAIVSMVLIYGLDQIRFWSLILPHGVIELAAVFIAGGAGLLIGRGMLIPGDLTRAQSFIKGAKEAFYFIPGITLMLIIAGVIEGFFTPLNIPEAVKLIFAFLTLLIIGAYFGLCGKSGRRQM